MAGADEDEAGGVGGHGRLKSVSLILQRARTRPRARPPRRSRRKPPAPMSQALHPMLNIAIKAARAPGRSSTAPRSTSSGCRSTRRRRTTSSPRSTTPPRRRSSTRCSRAYPGHGILAEESGTARGARDSEYVWIIDPLDGTTNFIHGLPTYAVSIGLAFRDQIQQAVVYDPARNDLFYRLEGTRRLPQRQAAARLEARRAWPTR